ncbi:MAG: universal stress protein [Chlorobiaceae bacterium]|nr:universal stress protein [Chlorobiaceae bacterium]MBA4308795.1 universal stress protein [Chlorobiaceae bacterium]
MNLTIKKIIVPVDFSDFSKSALKYSVQFAKNFSSELIITYVIEPIIYPPDFSMGQIALPSVNLQMDERAKEELEKLVKIEIGEEVPVRIVIRTGKPFVEIIELAREEEADLIIISSHGHSGVEYILFGSTADKVVRKAPCPVLTLRDPLKGFNIKKFS